MKIQLKSPALLSALLLGLNAGALHAQVATITGGALSTNTSAKLKFVNGTNFAAGSGFVQPLIYQRVATRFSTNNYYCSTNLLFQALSVKTNAATAAGFGAYLACQVMSVSGPVGGVLSYWEQGTGWPTYDFPVGAVYVSGKNRFLLSNCENGAGRPDGDPFGNIRGRRFSVNKPGEYLVTFKLYDVSKNHPVMPGSAIHTPSDPLTVKFSTGLDMNITQLTRSNDILTLVYKQGALTNMVLESTTNLASGNWLTVAGPFTNTPAFTTNKFTNSPASPSQFYRLRGVMP